VLYRSAQPERHTLKMMHQRYGIRTIANLRSPSKVASDPRAVEERAYARSTVSGSSTCPMESPPPRRR